MDKYLARVQRFFPGAVALEVIGPTVWVLCQEWSLGDRVLPAGTVKLGSSPETAALADEIFNDR